MNAHARPAADRAPIPLMVIGGYLGAGKTTLVNHLLAHADGRRIAVLVNDFGAVNIDAALIRERTDDVISLENGCICCSIGGRLVDTLVALADRVPRPDVLVIEASGVSDPLKIAQIGLVDRAFRLDGVIVAVDAAHVDATLADRHVGDIARRQIAGATLVVLTKTDLVSPRQRDDVAARVAALAGTALLIDAVDGAVPAGWLFDPARDGRPANAGPRATRPLAALDSRAASALPPGLRSLSFGFDHAFDRRLLRAAFAQHAPTLLRAKGIVRLHGDARAHAFHAVGSQMRFTPLAGDAPARSTLVAIGCFDDADAQRLAQRLDAACAA